jgi:hypothetical protein
MQSNGLRFVSAIVVLLIIFGVVAWLKSGYSRISDQGYDYALALVSACSRQDESRVQQIAQEITESELPDYDRRVILAIAQQALEGDWQSAANLSRQLLKAQVQAVY